MIKFVITITLSIRGVNTRRVLIVAQASFESAILSVIWCIVRASNTVENVLTVLGRAGTSWVAYLHAECVTTHEARWENQSVKLEL